MYIFTPSNSSPIYPYSLHDLRRDNPGTSFPDIMSNLELLDWNIYPVEIRDPVFNKDTEKAVESFPILDNGNWVQNWEIFPLTENELLIEARKNANYISFYDLLIASSVYQKIRTQSRQSLPLTVACTEFIAAIADAKLGRPNEAAIQTCICNILLETVLTDSDIADLQVLLDASKLSKIYILSNTFPENFKFSPIVSNSPSTSNSIF